MKKINSSAIILNPTSLQKGSVTDQIEDRSAYLRSADLVTWTGTQLQFTQDIVLEIINTLSGTTSTHTILVANSPLSIADGDVIYAAIDRTATSENITPINSSSVALPAQSNTNRDIFVIAKRIDVSGAGYLHLPFSRQVLNPGQSVRLGASGSGSGGGGAGLNFVPLDSNFQSNKQSNVDAEANIGDWLAYQDAAGTSPVDMTGGSPTVTISQTVTVGEFLNGKASFLITKDAANRQGEGVSVVVNVPLGYRGFDGLARIPFKVISGSLVQGDLKFYLYDITNSQVITPFNNDVVGSQGLLTSLTMVPSNCSQLRIGFHFASTSTSALTLSFDDVFFGNTASTSALNPNRQVTSILGVAAGINNGEVTTNILTFTAKATALYELKGINHWTIAAGVTVTSEVRTYSGSANVPVTTDIATAIGATAGAATGTDLSPRSLFSLESGKQYSFVFYVTSGGGSFNSGYLWAEQITPDQTQANLFQSQTFNISNILVNGTNVTSTPTQLGEYRTFIKNASSQLGTDDTPSVGPSSANGMIVYGDKDGPTAGTSGETGRWEIFVGKNKSVTPRWYSTTGKTGQVSIDVVVDPTGTTRGIFYGYDENTGIFWVDGMTNFSPVAAGRIAAYGFGDTGFTTNLTNLYFDLVVSENALAIGVQNPRSEVFVGGGGGYGSTNTFIRIYQAIEKQIGTAITYVTSATDGDSFLINEDGLYGITVHELHDNDTTLRGAGASLNSVNLTSALDGNPVAEVLCLTSIDRNLARMSTSCAGVNLKRGDVVRSHAASNIVSAANQPTTINFRIVKLSN